MTLATEDQCSFGRIFSRLLKTSGKNLCFKKPEEILWEVSRCSCRLLSWFRKLFYRWRWSWYFLLPWYHFIEVPPISGDDAVSCRRLRTSLRILWSFLSAKVTSNGFIFLWLITSLQSAAHAFRQTLISRDPNH